ncbi:MAG: DUF1631 family protein, partial [Rubrivivax sp.]|nr:DUF1631 family protein [Rubrivivax sp.]
MTPPAPTRLPAALESAVQRVKQAVRSAVERSIESLGLSALTLSQVFVRDNLLAAQFELNRKSALFVLAFEEAFDERSLRAWTPRTEAAGANSRWATLSLVDEQDVEVQVAGDRAGAEIANACEWELRELDTYVGSLLGGAAADPDRNPLRPALLGYAMLRGLEKVSERADLRKLLAAELGRSLASTLRKTYADIVADLRKAGVQPLGLAVRLTEARAGERTTTAQTPLDRGATAAGTDSERQVGASMAGGLDSRRQRGSASGGAAGGQALGSVDPGMMALMRRLAHVDDGAGAGA